MEPLGLDFGGMLASKIEPKTEPKMEKLKKQKFDSRVGGGSVFEGQGVSKIDEKSMPKRLQDKIGFQEAKKHEKVSNIGPSWSPKSSQVALKIEVKNHLMLNDEKGGPSEMTKWFLASTGGKPPGLRMRYED